MNDRPRTSFDRPMSSGRIGRGWEMFQSPTGFRNSIVATPKEERPVLSEEKKQLNLILNELRKELGRMDHDEWRYPVTKY